MSSGAFNSEELPGGNVIRNNSTSCIKELKTLVLEDSKLNKFRTEDEYLLRFLHSSGFDVALALKKMQNFTALILEHPTWFSTASPLERKALIEINDTVLLQGRDKCGRRIIVFKIGNVDAINSCPREKSELFDLWLESIMDDVKTQENGLSAIVDMNGYSWRIFKWLTHSNIKIATKKMDLYPFKELVLHIVNTSFLLNATIKLLWPLFNDKLKKMFKFHFDNWPSLHEHIDLDVLPAEYSGTGQDIDFEKSNQALFDENTEIGRKVMFVREGIDSAK